VSVIQTRRLVAVPGGVDLFVEDSEPPLLCQLRAPDGTLLTRSRVFAQP
jgi:hypothetical protein